VADFFDAIVIGDGEEVVVEICDLVQRAKEAGEGKEDILQDLSQLEGVYVPLVHTEDKPIRRERSRPQQGIVSHLPRGPFHEDRS